VERVTGRLTKARATVARAACGAWFGLFIGLIVGLFTAGPAWLGLILGGLLIGAAWGAIFGFAGHAATRGRRDFSSAQTLTATRYDIIARGGTAGQARSNTAAGRHACRSSRKMARWLAALPGSAVHAAVVSAAA
jgi:hypothetical protein